MSARGDGRLCINRARRGRFSKGGYIKPVISIVVTSYIERSKRFLDLCIESIRELKTSVPIEVVIVSPHTYQPFYEGCRTVSPPEPIYGMPRGLNYGISKAEGDYLMVVNDDVIFTHDSVEKLYSTLANSACPIGCLMPISNDQQGRYMAYTAPAEGQPLAGPLDFQDVSQRGTKFMAASSVYPPMLMFHDTLCVYAFMITRKAMNKIGPFDENLTLMDDLDWTMRGKQAGYLNAIQTDAIIWHFGGVSTSDRISPEFRADGLRRFNEKWGQASRP